MIAASAGGTAIALYPGDRRSADFDLKTVSRRAKDIFGRFFNEKLFREQLASGAEIE